MVEWGSAQVTLVLAVAGAFMSLLLSWYSQNQRLAKMEGRILEVERGERECIERERRLSERVSELEKMLDHHERPKG